MRFCAFPPKTKKTDLPTRLRNVRSVKSAAHKFSCFPSLILYWFPYGILFVKKENALDSSVVCQGRMKIRGATLIHGRSRALCGIPAYPRQLTYAPTLQNTLCRAHLTAPSAAHLTTCFLPDSQRRRLSVRALLPLLPLHRFKELNYSIFRIISRRSGVVNVMIE